MDALTKHQKQLHAFKVCVVSSCPYLCESQKGALERSPRCFLAKLCIAFCCCQTGERGLPWLYWERSENMTTAALPCKELPGPHHLGTRVRCHTAAEILSLLRSDRHASGQGAAGRPHLKQQRIYLNADKACMSR